MSSDPRMTKNISNLSSIGAALKEERLNLGMTQIEVARKFGISLKALRNLEQGRGGVSFDTVQSILRLFGKEIRIGDVIMSPSNPIKSRPRRKEVLETFKLIKPILEKKYSINKIVLFGSCARDKAKKGSDIDIALKFDESPSFSELGKLIVYLENLFDGHKVDLVELKKMVPEVLKTAKKDFIYV